MIKFDLVFVIPKEILKKFMFRDEIRYVTRKNYNNTIGVVEQFVKHKLQFFFILSYDVGIFLNFLEIKLALF